MSQPESPESRTRAALRACVVNAVREGDALMAQLIAVARAVLTQQESDPRDISQRNLASDALALLWQHESALVKAYPMALLENFAEGPGAAAAPSSRHASLTGMDFGELSLVDDAEVQAQVELARAQQQAQHTTDVILAELNALVSAAQGLHRVQPERNPLRPENYIRALQQVVAKTGVSAQVRESWMQPMRDFLGQQLIAVYQRAAQSLHRQGVEPVGYGVASSLVVRSTTGVGGGRSAGLPHTGYGAEPYGPATGWSHAEEVNAQAEEIFLTEGVLRQLFSGGGDLYEAMPSHCAAPAPDSPAQVAAEIVARMVQNIAQDARLLPPIQRAVQALKPVIGQLAQIDPQFFSDEQHPARRLLDALTQRSMVFSSEDAPGFARFMQMVHQAVGHLAGQTITSATPFASVLKALETAWKAQQQNQQAEQRQKEAQSEAEAMAKIAQQQQQQLTQSVAAKLHSPLPLPLPMEPQAPADEALPDAPNEGGVDILLDDATGSDSIANDAHQIDFLLESGPPIDSSPFRVGLWVELVGPQKRVRTQLTWASPQGTLFLFTAPDGSTQSMTLRTRDRLLAEGTLHILPP